MCTIAHNELFFKFVYIDILVTEILNKVFAEVTGFSCVEDKLERFFLSATPPHALTSFPEPVFFSSRGNEVANGQFNKPGGIGVKILKEKSI